MNVIISKGKAPIEIWSGYLNAPQSYRDKLVEATYKEKANATNINWSYEIFNEENGKVVATNHYAWQTVPLYNKLLKNIEKAIYNWIKTPDKYKIHNAWSGVYNVGQQTRKHSHHPSTYSFCYYMRAEAPYTPMVFDDCDIEIDAKTDLLIIFPSFLNHSVPPCKNERVFISGNAIPTHYNINVGE